MILEADTITLITTPMERDLTCTEAMAILALVIGFVWLFRKLVKDIKDITKEIDKEQE